MDSPNICNYLNSNLNRKLSASKNLVQPSINHSHSSLQRLNTNNPLVFETPRNKSPSFSPHTLQKQKSPFKRLEDKFRHLEEEYENISRMSDSDHGSMSRRTLSPRISERHRQKEKRTHPSTQNTKKMMEAMLLKVRKDREAVSQQVKDFESKFQIYINGQFNVLKRAIVQFVEFVLDNNREQFKRQYEKKIMELNKSVYVTHHKLNALEKRVSKMKQSVQIPHFQASIQSMEVDRVAKQIQQASYKVKHLVPQKLIAEIEKQYLKTIEKSLKDILSLEPKHRSIYR